LGKVVLPITFGTRNDYRTENVKFDVAEITLPYNRLLGRPALALFMAATHYAYNMIMIPTTWGVLTIRLDIGDAVFCIAEMDKAVVAGEPGSLSEVMLEDADPGPSSAKKWFSPELAAMVCEGVGHAPRKGARERGRVDQESAPG
jgi:hypothetical protein